MADIIQMPVNSPDALYTALVAVLDQYMIREARNYIDMCAWLTAGADCIGQKDRSDHIFPALLAVLRALAPELYCDHKDVNDMVRSNLWKLGNDASRDRLHALFDHDDITFAADLVTEQVMGDFVMKRIHEYFSRTAE